MMLPQQLTSVYVAILNSQLEWLGLSVVSYSVSHVPQTSSCPSWRKLFKYEKKEVVQV
jgi:hypothetical protein